MERVTFKELPDVKYDDQYGDEDKSTNAFILEFDSCSTKALHNNISSQMNEDDNDAEVAR